MISIKKIFAVNNGEFFEMFERDGVNILRGAELLDKLMNDPKRKTLAKDIIVCEHEGDKITLEITQRLNQTFVTPFDREDIYELATELDDILDFIEESADYISLYQLTKIRPHAKKQTAILVKAVKEISLALPKLQGFKDINDHITEIYRLEHEGDKVVREAIATLFKEDVDHKTLYAWKDVFDRLEDAIDKSEKVAHILKGIVIRNS